MMNVSEILNDYKEQIKMAATQNKIKTGEDKNGLPVFEVVSKETAIERILAIYDNTAYQYLSLKAASNAIERILHDYHPDLDKDELVRKFVRYSEEEKLNERGYIYESDKKVAKELHEQEKKSCRSRFSVIDGGAGK